MPELLAGLCAPLAARLVARGETVAVSESSTGGLISAALLSIPGALEQAAELVAVFKNEDIERPWSNPRCLQKFDFADGRSEQREFAF